jgi:hypothetical protein
MGLEFYYLRFGCGVHHVSQIRGPEIELRISARAMNNIERAEFSFWLFGVRSKLTSKKCKLIRERCGDFLGCADFD